MKRYTNLIRIALSTAFVFVSFASSLRALEPNDGFPVDASQTYALTTPKGLFSPTAFTAAAWINTEAPNVSQGILDIGLPAKFFTFYIYDGAVRTLVQSDPKDGSYSFALAPAPEKNVWTHYCGTYDGQTIRIYRNGKLAAEKKMQTSLANDAFDGQTLQIGAVAPEVDRPFQGRLNDVAIWNRVLDAREVGELFSKGAETLDKGRVALWNASSVASDGAELVSGSLVAKKISVVPLLNRKDVGYRGIWYYNQKIDNEYVFKYSGGMGTYPANHYPFSVYRPEVDKTFFCYGGFDPDERTLWHEVGVYDHKTNKVSRPTVLVDKKTEDAHDNPVMSMNDEGYIFVFSTSHGTGRPSFIHKSVRPYDISEFELLEPTKLVDGAPVPMTNFSYFQVWNVPERGFFTFFTTYDRSLVADVDPNSQAARLLAFMTSPDGKEWSAWKPLAAIEMGHYQNACVRYNREKKAADGKTSVKMGTSFNYHPAEAKRGRGTGLNWRTNLYYIESNDLGETWQTVDGQKIETPLLNSANPALVRNYEDENLNVYVTDLSYDSEGRPIIAYVTSKGFESGPEMGPRYFCVARWLGDKWDFSTLCQVDNNYEYAMFYPEEAQDGVWRLVGSFEDGPQAYNTGGEISQWVSRDFGKTWSREIQLTEKSALNQCFPRRTIDASPDFYAFWAEGNGREKSISTLKFSTKDGKVFALPREMKEDWETPTLLTPPSTLP